MKKLFLTIAGGMILTAAASGNAAAGNAGGSTVTKDGQGPAEATFAGGCFWCMQPPYDKTPGVLSTVVGYTGGTKKDPTYEEVTGGQTGHAEAVRIYYDPKQVSYEKLLEIFWKNIDPTQQDGQFADRGSQYRTAIFYHDDEQKKLAGESRERLAKSGKFSKPIVTEIAPAGDFYRAELYHQDYYKKNATHYKLYSIGSGREPFLKNKWKEENAPPQNPAGPVQR
jgi:methionine-S-sulfoxide reductase